MKFKESSYKTDDELLFPMMEVGARKAELNITDAEWFSVWMLERVRKRKSLEAFHYQELRNIMKDGGDNVVKRFNNQFK